MTLIDRLSKKGLTASGNVAESHCVPILAPFNPFPWVGEPIAFAKLRKVERKTKENPICFVFFSNIRKFDN